jgi:hypothetical protein
MNLIEAIDLRKNELSRLLAGSTAIDPIWTIDKIGQIRDALLTDLTARKYIRAVREKLPELQAVSDDEQSKIVVRIATETGILSDYCKWVCLPSNLYQDVPAAIQELKALSITSTTLADLQDWIKDIEAFAS